MRLTYRHDDTQTSVVLYDMMPCFYVMLYHGRPTRQLIKCPSKQILVHQTKTPSSILSSVI
jgi:hypothetical protein